MHTSFDAELANLTW